MIAAEKENNQRQMPQPDERMGNSWANKTYADEFWGRKQDLRDQHRPLIKR